MALIARALQSPPQPRVTARRRAQRVRARAASQWMRIAAIAAIPVVFALAYIWLTAMLTAQTYQLHDAQQRGAVLMRRYNDLHQQEARLESLPRLEAAAMKLHMTAPKAVALIELPQAPQAAQRAVPATIADVFRWFGAR
jgi:hypothetical protein